MDNLQIKAILAGLFFGTWPLLMNRSGLSGMVSAMAFTGLAFVIIAPFALSHLGDFSNVKWQMVIGAGVLGAGGIMCFTGMLAKATVQSVSTLFVLTIVIQNLVPAIYEVIVSGGVSFTKGIGFAFAAVASVLLVKG